MRTASDGWRKSSYSPNDAISKNCVEVMHRDGAVYLRDSKDPDGPMITFRPEQFAVFLREATGPNVDVTRDDRELLVAGRPVVTRWHVRSHATGETLHFTADEWDAFRRGAEDGEFDTASTLASASA